MEKAEILEILEEWNFWKREQETGINRAEYAKELQRLSETEQVVAIMGIRRSGKSTIMRQYIKYLIEKGVKPNNILYVNFEDLRFREFDLNLLDQIYEIYLERLKPGPMPFIFLDEVQKIKDWERFARTMHELRKARIFVSGSNAKLLSGNLASVLTGRHLDIEVFPLDFKEFLFFNSVEAKNELDALAQKYKIKSLFEQYLEYGGFPLVALKESKKEILQTYFEDIINKDVVENYKIENVLKVKALAKFYLTNIGRRVSFNNLAKTFGLSLDSVERYSYYLQEAYLAFFIKKFSYSVKEQEKTRAVVYCIDNGLRNLMSFKFSIDYGWLYQNIVANALIKEFGKENIFYWMNDTKEECDFVVKEKMKVRQLIQVCYSLENTETKEREMKSLLKASKELKCNNLIVINENKESEEKFEGKKIKFVTIWKWLLS